MNMLPSPVRSPLRFINPIVVNMTERQTFVIPPETLGQTTCPRLKRIFEQEEGLAVILHQNQSGQCELIAAPAKKRLFGELQPE